ncbi:g-protein complex gamma subunit ste18 [Lasallia pustulata]|uniref:Guanine nucleotide-binding protein subunit gamma n=1 Tax=Lasallia pustulata TaxID=136370 RepID=A0A1W5CUB0_9LECA|nr:g-protein complex gamma subunit ste18 [Lasallia pustulata]
MGQLKRANRTLGQGPAEAGSTSGVPTTLVETFPRKPSSPIEGHQPTSIPSIRTQLSSTRLWDPSTIDLARDSKAMAPTYEIRAGGDGKNKKQSMADLKLRRLNELNGRLTEDLNRPRIRVSEAASSLVQYCNSTKDFMVPSLWGQVDKREDPYSPVQSGSCCSVM